MVVWNLTESEYVRVQQGDMIAFYFPGENPIPYTAYQCYSRKDQLRYISDPESMKVGETYTFGVAPLAMSACREYSIQTLVGKSRCLNPDLPSGLSQFNDGHLSKRITECTGKKTQLIEV